MTGTRKEIMHHFHADEPDAQALTRARHFMIQSAIQWILAYEDAKDQEQTGPAWGRQCSDTHHERHVDEDEVIDVVRKKPTQLAWCPCWRWTLHFDTVSKTLFTEGIEGAIGSVPNVEYNKDYSVYTEKDDAGKTLECSQEKSLIEAFVDSDLCQLYRTHACWHNVRV